MSLLLPLRDPARRGLTHPDRPIGRRRGSMRPSLAMCLALVAATALLGSFTGCGADSAVAADKADASAVRDTRSGDIADVATASVLVAASGATAGARVELDAVVESDESITVRVLLRGYAELYAIASHLAWDPKALQLLEHKAHLMMQGEGYGARTLVKPTGDGVLLLGAARFKDGGSPWSQIHGAKVGNELWATLRFKLLGDTAKLSFDPLHSLAKDATYKAVETGWQELSITRNTAAAGGGQ